MNTLLNDIQRFESHSYARSKSSKASTVCFLCTQRLCFRPLPSPHAFHTPNVQSVEPGADGGAGHCHTGASLASRVPPDHLPYPRDSMCPCTSRTTTTRRTTTTISRGACGACTAARTTASPPSTSPASRSRTRAGTSVRWCSSTDCPTSIKTVPGTTSTCTVSTCSPQNDRRDTRATSDHVHLLSLF